MQMLYSPYFMAYMLPMILLLPLIYGYAFAGARDAPCLEFEHSPNIQHVTPEHVLTRITSRHRPFHVVAVPL